MDRKYSTLEARRNRYIGTTINIAQQMGQDVYHKNGKLEEMDKKYSTLRSSHDSHLCATINISQPSGGDIVYKPSIELYNYE